MSSKSLAVVSSHPSDLPQSTPDWERLVRFYSPDLCRFLGGRLRRLRYPVDSDTAQEVVQETWCRAFERGGRRLGFALADGESTTRSYLYLLATRILIDMLRSGMAAKRQQRLGPLDGPIAIGAEARARDPYCNPEVHLFLREGRRAFARECLRLTRSAHRGGLRRRNLRILRRALLEGWSSREIVRAERGHGLQLTIGAIDTMISRARARFCRAGWRLPNRGLTGVG